MASHQCGELAALDLGGVIGGTMTIHTTELANIRLNGDTTLLNASAMVTVLLGDKMEAQQQSPFRVRMPRLWEMADVPFETIQTGSANHTHRGRTDYAVTLECARQTWEFCQENGLLIPQTLQAVTRQRQPLLLEHGESTDRIKVLEEELSSMRQEIGRLNRLTQE